MAASVLGKRPRNALSEEDLGTLFPTTKRQTRRSTPKIYEDATETSTESCKAIGNSELEFLPDAEPVTTHTKVPRRIVQSKKIKPSSRKPIADYFLGGADENVDPVVFKTPTTQRFKDFLANSPSTPKHRVRLAGKPLTPSTPRTHSPLKTQTQSVYAQARQLFSQSSNSGKLVGRDVERCKIVTFIDNAINQHSGNCLYVSGPPGTGKSALVQEILEAYQDQSTVDVAIVNCVALESSTEVMNRLEQEFCPGVKCTKTTLAKKFASNTSSKMQVLLLDEIDYLVSTNCDILHKMFEWALQKSSSLILIGIANALDLTERFLPRLKTRNLKPELLPFLPYTAKQISEIVSEKLRGLLPDDSRAAGEFVPFMHPAAIQLCGKKVSSQTGDLRKVFDLARRAIDQVEKETMDKMSAEPDSLSRPVLTEKSNLLDPQTSVLASSSSSKPITPAIPKSKFETLTVETAPRVSIAHIARVASSIFNNGTTSRLSGLNLQQKAVLCSLVADEKKRKARDPYATPSKSSVRISTIQDLFGKYTLLCKRDDGILQPLKNIEFRDVVTSLETLGLVHEPAGRAFGLLTPSSTPSKTGRNADKKQIVSGVSEKEMRACLDGAGADLLLRLLEE